MEFAIETHNNTHAKYFKYIMQGILYAKYCHNCTRINLRYKKHIHACFIIFAC